MLTISSSWLPSICFRGKELCNNIEACHNKTLPTHCTNPSLFSLCSWNCATTLKLITRHCLLPIAEILLHFLNFLELCNNTEDCHKILPTTHCRNPSTVSQFLGIVQEHWRSSQDIAYPLQKSFPIFSISWNSAKNVEDWHKISPTTHCRNPSPLSQFLGFLYISAIKEFRVPLLTCTNLWIKDEEREHLLIFSCCSQARMIIYAQVMLEPHNCHCLPTASSCCWCWWWWWCQAMCRAIFSGGVTPDCGDEQPCSSKSVPFLRHSGTVDTWNTLEVEESTTSRRKLLLWKDGS